MTPRRCHDERGTAATELVLATPVLVALMLFVVLCGRLAAAGHDVDAAAESAARAASLHTTPDGASAAAQDAATVVLADRHLTCAGLTVATDTSQLAPGGMVIVDVTCAVDLADVALIGVPGTKTVTARAIEPIDRYRSTP